MQEKFIGLSKTLRWVIVLLSWVVTIGGFVGCLMIKQYADLPWLEIILTLLGMLFCVVSICLTIVHVTAKPEKEENSEKSL